MNKFVITGELDVNKNLTMTNIPRQNQGENMTAEIRISLPEIFVADNDFYLEFLCPHNIRFISPKMQNQQPNTVVCPVPACVLQEEGFVQIQLVARNRDDLTVVFKSNFSNRASFFVHAAVNATYVFANANDYFAQLESSLRQTQQLADSVTDFLDSAEDVIDQKVTEQISASTVELYRLAENVVAPTLLPAPTQSLLGKIYTVGTQAPFEIWVCEKQNGVPTWLNHGSIQGPQGERGPKGDPGAGINPNLLLNGDFSINTSGDVSHTGFGYFVDGWQGFMRNCVMQKGPDDTAMTLTGMCYQVIPNFRWLAGKTVTFSAEINGVEISSTATLPSSFGQTVHYMSFHNYAALRYESSSQRMYITLGRDGETIEVAWAKLEVGDSATPLRRRNNNEELATCGNLTNGKNETKYFDDIPTFLQITGPNLLANGDFRINQRGGGVETPYTETLKYCVDRWVLSGGTLTVNNDGSVTHEGTEAHQGIFQTLENPARFAGKTLTLSALAGESVANDLRLTLGYHNPGETYGFLLECTEHRTVTPQGILVEITTEVPTRVQNNALFYAQAMHRQAGARFTLQYMKLEVSERATAFTPKSHAEELTECQYYYQKIPAGIWIGHTTGQARLARMRIPLLRPMRRPNSIAQRLAMNVSPLNDFEAQVGVSAIQIDTTMHPEPSNDDAQLFAELTLETSSIGEDAVIIALSGVLEVDAELPVSI